VSINYIFDVFADEAQQLASYLVDPWYFFEDRVSFLAITSAYDHFQQLSEHGNNSRD
jgi:hypothetical protein